MTWIQLSYKEVCRGRELAMQAVSAEQRREPAELAMYIDNVHHLHQKYVARAERVYRGTAPKLGNVGYLQYVARRDSESDRMFGGLTHAQRELAAWYCLYNSWESANGLGSMLIAPDPVQEIESPELLKSDNPIENLPEETIMKLFKVETVVRVNGTDADQLNDDQLIGYIKDLEDQIVELESIKIASTCIHGKIDSLRANVKELAKLLDNRCKDC